MSEQKGQKDAQIVLDNLAETLSNDPQASGGIVVHDEPGYVVLSIRIHGRII